MKILKHLSVVACIVVSALSAGSALGQTQTGGKPLCPITTGSIIDTSTAGFPYGCGATPTVLTVKMYRIGLCTSNPAPTNGTDANGDPTISPTVALNYSSCTFALDSSAGVSTNLSVGGSSTLGTAPAFPIGTYPYGVMVVGNANSVTTTQSFSTSLTGGAFTSGTFCSTNGGSTFLSTAPALDVSPEPGGNTYLTRCGNTAPTAVASTVTLDTFDNQAAASLQPVVGTTAIAPQGAPTGDRFYGFLRQSDGITVPTGTAGASTATRLVAVYKFKTAVNVTAATTSFSVNSIVTGSVRFGGSSAYLSRMLAGPFVAYLTAN